MSLGMPRPRGKGLVLVGGEDEGLSSVLTESDDIDLEAARESDLLIGGGPVQTLPSIAKIFSHPMTNVGPDV